MLTDARPIQDRFAAVQALLNQDNASASRLNNEITRINAEASKMDGAILLCQRCLDDQADMKKFVESLVTAMLQAVFDPGHSFVFETQFDTAQGRITGLKPMIIEGDTPKRQGGGARNVASLAIRMCFNAFLAKRMNLTPIMVLDEQLNNLDADRWPRLVKFLMDMQSGDNAIGLQMIFISHQEFDMGRTITFTKSGRMLTKVMQEGDTVN